MSNKEGKRIWRLNEKEEKRTTTTKKKLARNTFSLKLDEDLYPFLEKGYRAKSQEGKNSN